MTPLSTTPRPDIAEIKLTYPLLDVVERAGVRLRRSGSYRFQGLCPFHEDRNPSFFIDVERQRFVCFGCKARGDVIDFVQLHEHLGSVAEACARLTETPAQPVRTDSIASAANADPQRRWDRLTLEQ